MPRKIGVWRLTGNDFEHFETPSSEDATVNDTLSIHLQPTYPPFLDADGLSVPLTTAAHVNLDGRGRKSPSDAE